MSKERTNTKLVKDQDKTQERTQKKDQEKTSTATEYVLEAEKISKAYPGVQALKDVQLRVKRGTVHALMGENGAGKSTLMKILIGLEHKDEGSILFKAQDYTIGSTREALDRGLAMIHQELNPVLHMSVAENIFLGKEIKNSLGLVNYKAMLKESKDLLDSLDIRLNPDSKMIDLSIAQMQMVEIAKAISYNADLIIMDEPTSAITEKEVAHLFGIIKKLKDKEISIIFITHKMDEVFKITDEVTVFRDGHYIDSQLTSQLNREKLIQMMVGRDISVLFPKKEVKIQDVVLKVEHLSREGVFEDVSFEVRKGEIVGFAGLIGSGRTEVLECLFGVTKRSSGKVYLHDKLTTIATPTDAIKNGLAFLTEDRKLSGLYLVLSVLDNIVMANIQKYRKYGLLKDALMLADGDAQKNLLSIKTPSLGQIVNNLSGGNQQKVLVGRWLLTSPEILILDEPTRGIDVGAKAEIHKLMGTLVEQGKSIIMISSELPEVLGMSDRIVVMHEGKKSGELSRSEASQEKILHLATGASLDTFLEEDYK